MNRIDLILELREAYQAAEFGIDTDKRMEIQWPLLRLAKMLGIENHYLSDPPEIFELFKEKLITQSI
jgi:hypothetical protein